MTINKTEVDNLPMLNNQSEVQGDVDGGEASKPLEVNRRAFISRVGATAVAAGALGSATAFVPETALADFGSNGDIQNRKNQSFKIRHDAAKDEKQRPNVTHPTNGDEDLYPNKIGNFSKTLPHDAITGEVDPIAYDALVAAIDAQSFSDLEAVPGNGRLLNPLGAFAFNIDGPDNNAIGVIPPPALASPEFAAQLGELYWMSYIRDVPFAEYGTDPDALAAQADLTTFSGYTGPTTAGSVGPDDLFRTDYPGVRNGPMVSQFLYQGYALDGIAITPRINAPDLQEFLIDFPSYVNAQNGNAGGGIPTIPGQTVYPRTARDLGYIAGNDFINSAYLRAARILGFFLPADAANPYSVSTRQFAFATFGIAHLTELLGKVHKGERHAWFQKWCVHRFLRPEAAGARAHRVRADGAAYPLHADLITSSNVLDLSFARHGSYLLPQMFPGGSPSHPAFTAGHAITAGACVTLLKAWVDEDRAWPPSSAQGTYEPTADGQALNDISGTVSGLTLGGELNKLAHNLSFGRDMSGVHWRADDIEGNIQGEELAIRLLAEEKATYPETFSGFSLTKFDGSSITI